MSRAKLFSDFYDMLLISLAGSIGGFDEHVCDAVHCRRHDHDIVCLRVAVNQRHNMLERLLAANGCATELHHDSQVELSRVLPKRDLGSDRFYRLERGDTYPDLTRYSATKTAPLAAPSFVLWLTKTYLTPCSRAESWRIRPTVTAMPPCMSRSSLG